MKNSNTKEINLVDILSIIGRGIKSFFLGLVRLVGRLAQLLYRHIILTSILVLLAIVIGQYLSRPSNRVYKVGAMGKLYGAKTHTVLEIGEQLSKTSPIYSNSTLEEKLGLPQAIVEKIKKIDFFRVIDYQRDSIPDRVDFDKNHSLNDTVNTLMENYIYVQFEIRDVEHIDKIGHEIEHYLNTNPTLQEGYRTYTDGLIERIELCRTEIKRLDSVADKSYFEDRIKQLQFQNNQLLVGNQHLQLFYYDQLKLQEIKSNTEQMLVKATSPIVFPAGFVLDPHPVNGRVTNGIKSIVIGLALSLLLSLCIENYGRWLAFLRRE